MSVKRFMTIGPYDKTNDKEYFQKMNDEGTLQQK